MKNNVMRDLGGAEDVFFLRYGDSDVRKKRPEGTFGLCGVLWRICILWRNMGACLTYICT